MPAKAKSQSKPKRSPAKGKTRSEAPSNAPSVADDRWFNSRLVLISPTAAGVPVNEDSAKRFSAVFGCVKAISETLATVPLFTYRRLPRGGKDRAGNHRIYKLLRLRPNRYQTSFVFRQFMFGCVLLWGDAYAEIIWDNGGEPAELRPIHPSRVTPCVADDGSVYYKVVSGGAAKPRIVFKRDMFHLVGLTEDGVSGYSPIGAMREGIGLGMAAEAFGAAFFGNGATPAAVIEYPGEIPEDEREAFKEKMDELYKGPKKAGKVGVLTSGMKLTTIGIPQADAQYIELRRFQIEEIARAYRVPLYKLQDHTHSTFSNIEHLAIEWVTDCLLPWAKRFEETVLRDLFNAEAELDDYTDEFFVEFLFEGLLRGDTQSRFTSYGTARQWGWLSINEIRERENMNPIGPEGNVYLQPLNMVPAGTPEPQGGKNADSGQAEADGVDDEPADGAEGDEPAAESKAQEEKLKAAFRGVFQETWHRIVRKEVGTVQNAARKRAADDFTTWRAEFLDELHDFASDCLRQAVTAYGGLRGVWDPTDMLVRVVQEYREQVLTSLEQYFEQPAEGYLRSVPQLATYWTERLLSYPEGDYGQAA